MSLRIALVVPHIFMQDSLRGSVIFSPADLALNLARGLQNQGCNVSLYTPGPVTTPVKNIVGDMSGFDEELALRGYGFLELLKKHPLTFSSLARQVQADLLARAFEDANNNMIDVVHIYTNEEDIGMQFARFCKKPVVFTHHDPFNLTSAYRVLFPRKKYLHYIALSEAQKRAMPEDTSWAATIPHGLPLDQFPFGTSSGNYVLFMGRIIESKGVHHAIAAVKKHNQTAQTPIHLKISGKYYQDGYFEEHVEPYLDENIEYVGFAKSTEEKQMLYGAAQATLMPSVFDEPFGMVAIESLACGTPVIGLNSGALPEIISHGVTGFLSLKNPPEAIVEDLAQSISKIHTIRRSLCREHFEKDFTIERVVRQHMHVYESLVSRSS